MAPRVQISLMEVIRAGPLLEKEFAEWMKQFLDKDEVICLNDLKTRLPCIEDALKRFGEEDLLVLESIFEVLAHIEEIEPYGKWHVMKGDFPLCGMFGNPQLKIVEVSENVVKLEIYTDRGLKLAQEIAKYTDKKLEIHIIDKTRGR